MVEPTLQPARRHRQRRGCLGSLAASVSAARLLGVLCLLAGALARGLPAGGGLHASAGACDSADGAESLPELCTEEAGALEHELNSLNVRLLQHRASYAAPSDAPSRFGRLAGTGAETAEARAATESSSVIPAAAAKVVATMKALADARNASAEGDRPKAALAGPSEVPAAVATMKASVDAKSASAEGDRPKAALARPSEVPPAAARVVATMKALAASKSAPAADGRLVAAVGSTAAPKAAAALGRIAGEDQAGAASAASLPLSVLEATRSATGALTRRVTRSIHFARAGANATRREPHQVGDLGLRAGHALWVVPALVVIALVVFSCEPRRGGYGRVHT